MNEGIKRFPFYFQVKYVNTYINAYNNTYAIR